MNKNDYRILLPQSSKHLKEFRILLKRRKKQTEKAIEKLQKHPFDLTKAGIEKLSDKEVGNYSIRVSKGDRIIYDVNKEKKEVLLIRVGKHDIYRLL